MSSQFAISSDASMSGPISATGALGRFAHDLIVVELPELPEDERRATVEFVCRRVAQIPTPLRVGVVALSAATGLAQRTFGAERTTSFLRSTRLPFVGELSRMVRSLGFAYVWETWPETGPTGGSS